jgi:crotonobetainyl-CoA:carnitine CoA-transferase CaiB-like acyl-CoA transferase
VILDGIRIVDLTTGLAGPVATQLLAEAGAEVLKIEPPAGDPARSRQPTAFETWNRSKDGLVLDLGDSGDRARLDQLLAGADVLVHELTPAQATAHGLDDTQLRARFPDLIAASVIGYAHRHSDAERPWAEILVQARSGAMDEQLSHRPGPCFLRFPIASWPTAYLVAAGVLVRLITRQRTGRAGPVHTSLHQGLLAVLAMLWNDAESPSDFLRAKIPLPKAMPYVTMTLFECSDGRWVQTLGGFMENPLVLESCAMLGEEPPYSPFGTMPSAEAQALWRRMFRTRPAHEWIESFHATDVPAEYVEELGAVFRDEQVRVNDYVVDLDHPRLGQVRQAAAPFTTSPPSRVRRPAPALDESWTNWTDRPAAHVRNEPYAARPLAGMRVLDLGSYLAGPLAPMLLADLGADVIKVESTTGERMRRSEMLFIGAQRGKRSLAVDLNRPEGKEVLRRLIRWADVVHHNMRGPAADRIGLDEASVRAVNPGVVFSHVSAYGPHGEKSAWPGYDPIAQAASGWMLAGAGEGNPPLWHRFGMMDHQAALASLLPTLLAVYERDRTGRATGTTSSLLAAATMTNSETYLDRTTGEVAPVPAVDPNLFGLDPYYRIYPVGERFVAVAATTPAEQDALRAVCGASDFAAALADREPEGLLAELSLRGVPAELVRTEQELAFLRDEENQRLGLAVSYQHPEYGRLTQPGAFWDFVDQDLFLDRPPPTLGEHTREVLIELGFSAKEVGAFRKAGLIAGPGLEDS